MKRSHQQILRHLKDGCWIKKPRPNELVYELRSRLRDGRYSFIVRDIRATTIQEMRKLGLLDDRLRSVHADSE